MSDRPPLIQLDFPAAAALIAEAGRVLMVTHQRPDGDAIGSMCGLGLALMEHGKQVTMAVDGGVTDYLSFVPGSEGVLASLDSPQADLVISCDASDLARTGQVGAIAWALPCPKLVLDHHVTNTLFGDVHILHSDYVSTTEAVLHLLQFLGWELSPPIAKALLVGFMTDTISFRVGPVTALSLRQVALLMESGANLRETIERMLVRQEPGQVQLMGRGLARCQVEDRVAWTFLSLADFQALGLPTHEKPELSTEILRDRRAYVAAFFLESEEPGHIRLSLRAVPGFDVGTLAKDLGGGGHTLAAGVSLYETTLEAAMGRVLPLLKAEAARGRALYPR
jgi:phosphoesterase RecJ-like protein